MADIKVEDYLNEAVDIADTDLFDLTVDLGGGNFDSQRLTFATLKLILLGVRRFRVTRTSADFSTPALTNSLLIFTFPPGYQITTKTSKHGIEWLGGGATLTEAQEGILGELDRYSPGGPLNVFQAPGDTPDKFDHNTLNFLENWGANTDVRGTITSDVNLSLLTQGTIEYIFYIDQIK